MSIISVKISFSTKLSATSEKVTAAVVLSRFNNYIKFISIITQLSEAEL